ncbi:MAG: hypothetical protein FJZ96_13525 [Chloroflexi bacterium]|nr:hypothetical protein [Chloroflexota bacterium]
MEVGDVRFYVDRWKTVEEIERRELRALTPKQNWKQFNSIMRRAKRLGIRRGGDDEEMEVFMRWAKIREHYGHESA